jgi:tetratricopeptide (TPR) repeat protein
MKAAVKTAPLRLFVFGAAFITVLTSADSALAQDSLSMARELYASAAYEDALAVLNKLVPTVQASERLAVNQYRAFCLVALRRTTEADQAIEAVLSDEPSYSPTDADGSPRLLSAFASGRQRVLPAIMQRKYAHAKARFDRQEFAVAAAEFDEVLKILNSTDLADATSRPPLSDIRALAAGFRDLSARAAPSPTPAPAEAPVQGPVQGPIQGPAPSAPAVPAVRVYNAGEPRVMPPVILRQDMPPLPAGIVFQGQGVLEIIINEGGFVESATIRAPIDPRYDRLVLAATRLWRYQPAMVGTTPVKFRKMIGVKTKGD